MAKGRYMSFTDELDYSNELANQPAPGDLINNVTWLNDAGFMEIVERYGLPNEIAQELEEQFVEQSKKSLAEAIKRLTTRMAQNLHGFCVLRALGYHAQIESEGKEITSLRSIAKHFGVCHQYVDKVTNDMTRLLSTDAPKSLAIRTRKDNLKAKPPKGFITIGQAIKKFNITTFQINIAMKEAGLKFKKFTRGAKIVEEIKLKKALGTKEDQKRRRKPRKPGKVKMRQLELFT